MRSRVSTSLGDGLPGAEPAAILNVNDDEGNRRLVGEILRRAGFAVDEAADGVSALRAATEATDVVVLDVNLPDFDGFEICRRIKLRPATAHVPVLLLSAESVKTADRVYGLEEGADGYLTLPVEPRELVATVKSLLRVRRAEQSLAWHAARAMLTADVVVAVSEEGDLDAMLRRCAEAMVRHLRADAVGLWVPDSGAETLRMIAAAGADGISLDGLSRELPADAVRAARERRPHLEVRDFPGSFVRNPEWVGEAGVTLFVGYPLTAAGRLVGQIAVFARRGRVAEMSDAVAAVAETVALGIERRRTDRALRESQAATRRGTERIRELEAEIQALERIVGADTTAVTASTYDSRPLRESGPAAFAEAVEAFERLMGFALDERGHRVDHGISGRLRSLSDRLGFLRAGPRDVIDLYSAALRRATADATGRRDQATVEEGRLLVLELMGHLVSHYRAAAPVGRVPRVADASPADGSPGGAS